MSDENLGNLVMSVDTSSMEAIQAKLNELVETLDKAKSLIKEISVMELDFEIVVGDK